MKRHIRIERPMLLQDYPLPFTVRIRDFTWTLCGKFLPQEYSLDGSTQHISGYRECPACLRRWMPVTLALRGGN